ncbi:MAG: phospholipid/glycerol acyltransferase [Frankiales bacterium]|jgi:1-acyl-sn-glycerol-3-phosphate acyltransferase|nr:phospholipid/glycerol acyltransferase [Frankiales bacterium]
MRRRGRLGPWYRFAIALLKPFCLVLWRREASGLQHLPKDGGGLILAANHISPLDPITLSDCVLYDLDLAPRFLAKSSLFEGRGFVATVLRGAGQIPVHRQTADAARALDAAVASLARGETVVIYPEGTVTRDPDKWPMVARTGVARLALLSGAPVLPLAQWGAHEILDSYGRPGFHPFPRRTIRFRLGAPVGLSDLAEQPLTAEVLREGTERVMDALTAELEVLRGAKAPARRYDSRGIVTAEGDGRRTA